MKPAAADRECPDEEADRGAPAELVVEAEQEERRDRDDGDRLVLAAQIGRGALLDRRCDLAHPLVARGQPEQPDREPDAVSDGEESAQEREQHGVISEEAHCRLYVEGAEDSRRAEFLTHISGARAASYEKEG